MMLTLPQPFSLIHLAETGSTQDGAEDAVRQGCPGWTLVVADRQTGGRGRFGRPWVSEPGNLYATLVLRPQPGEPPAGTSLGLIGLATGLAVQEGVSGLAPTARIVLKWPNDVLLDGAKLSGILVELYGGCILVGFGINLAHSPQGLPYATACLADAMGQVPGVQACLDSLLPRLHLRLGSFLSNGFDAMRQDYLDRLSGLGGAVTVYRDAARLDRLDGILRGVDVHGRLLVEQDGRMEAVSAGDIVTRGSVQDLA